MMALGIGVCDVAWGAFVFTTRPDGSGIVLVSVGIVTMALASWLLRR